MNSQPKLSEIVRKGLLALLVISTLSVFALAQRVEQGKMYGDTGFRGEPINLNVVNTDIRDILNYVTEQYGINFVIDKSVKQTPVTVNVNDVPWNIALDSILRAQDLGIQVNGPILRVADKKILATEGELIRAAQETQLDGSPLYTEFIRLNYARAKGTLLRGTATSGTSSGGLSPYLAVNGPGAGAASSSSSSSSGSAGDNSGLLPVIQRRLSRRGSVEIDERSNSLIITDVRENIDAIRQLVAILDQPEPQVEIEARIVVASRSFSRDIGVQLSGMVFGARGQGAQGGTLPGATSGQPFPPTLPIQGPNNSLVSSIPNTVIGLTTGVFGTAQISMLISAGEQKGQAKVIATPRVTALNNREAIIESKTQIPITTVQPGSGAGGTLIATTTYIDVPLKLQITPQITDLGTVVLEVLAENSSTPQIVGSTAPSINTQKMQTQVTVPDGGTTVVGGVLFDDERENQDRTPGLSKIPLLGNLFKRKGVSKSTNEILFFITPRIYRPDYAPTTGTAGRKPSATILQPVPLGNPASNSSTPDTLPLPTGTPVVPMLPVQQPGAAATKP